VKSASEIFDSAHDAARKFLSNRAKIQLLNLGRFMTIIHCTAIILRSSPAVGTIYGAFRELALFMSSGDGYYCKDYVTD
jgi:hypothetical protein